MGKIRQHYNPNFFIPGAAKSGTTSLHELLDTHPKISMSKEKEPDYSVSYTHLTLPTMS